MSNDDLRVRQKLNSTVENKPVKSKKDEAKTGEVKPAEIQVGQELGKTSDSTSDVDLTQTAEKRAEQQQAEELAMLDDIAAMAFPEDIPSVINTMKTVNDVISNADNKEQKVLSVDEILDKLGIVLVTSDGQKITERLNALPKEVLAKIPNPKDIKDLLEENGLEINFDNLSTVLELSNHITLRTPEEIEKTENKREEIATQLRAQDLMTKLFLMEASWND
ncbi:MAG: hypothetical protein MJ180_04580, partial [Candidatus Gastranaerophilales bacterium]|nr:hypothetical protein [Candidatus Gastranaerophilales bacterium]